ncbi:MAG: hypothetical protein HFH35_04505 [Eubacterium sp.]|nr:hypothetical protein [Eubacterium sp.]
MKIQGVHIATLGMLRKHFCLQEVWETIDNGMLLDCQKRLARQNAYAARETAQLLEAYVGKDGLAEVVCAFYRDGVWDLAGLEHALGPLLRKSRDHNGNQFFSRNRKGIQQVVYSERIVWETGKAALFYLFLLLMLQADPQGEIAKEDFRFLCTSLETVPSESGTAGGKNRIPRLCSNGSGVFYLKEGMIYDTDGNAVSPENEKIGCFAYTQDLGLLAFTEQGRVSACTELDVKYEIAGALDQRQNGRVVMAAAYGELYVLLLDDGTIVSNVEDPVTEWNDLYWVGAGLNSITAIRGRNRCVMELGSDSRLSAYSDVGAVYTRSVEGCCRYMVLKENGVLVMDDGETETEVGAAAIDRDGYVYAVGEEIIFRKFDSKTKKSGRLAGAAGGRILELCKSRSHIYARAVCSDGEILAVVQV